MVTFFPGDDAPHSGQPNPEEAHASAFTATHWSVVLAAGSADPAKSAAALEQLCRVYWYPIYAFLRRQRGASYHDAQELTQSFFAHLLEKETLKKASPDEGRFRTFLLGVLKKFLANELDRQRAWKRGGRHETISLDAAMAEDLYACEPVDPSTPERRFDRQWASTLVKQALRRLRNEATEAGKADQFAWLEPVLTQPDTAGVCARFAAAFGKTEGAAKVELHRLRRRFGDLLRSEVAQTIARPEEVEAELRHLIQAIADGSAGPEPPL